MKTYPRTPRRKARHPRVPGFVPALPRRRSDGWTPERQARFLAALAVTRSVAAAARKVGMARETAYRLRRKPGAESFAAAWDSALGREPGKRKVTADERRLRAIAGLLKPRIYKGECTGIARIADNSALLGHLAHLDRLCRDAGREDERSHGFAGLSPCHEPARSSNPPPSPKPSLPPRPGVPISRSRGAPLAPAAAPTAAPTLQGPR